jgi:mannose-1-phosphate guanylyltransferase
VVLAGGVGSRFWPVSTPERPKQLLPLASERPLIVDTVERARALAPDERIRIVAGERLMGALRAVLPGLPDQVYLIEPSPRGTGPALAWAAWSIARLDPDAVLVSLHADHVIRHLPEFADTVRAAVRLARKEAVLVTIGVVPDRIETGFGHIQLGAPIPVPDGAEAFRVAAFHEKPSAATAKRYVRRGFLWNSGIFVWKASVFLEELSARAPEVAAPLTLLETGGPKAFFDSVAPCVVDTAVLERSDRVACVRASFAWDDLGSWEALSRAREGDSEGNVIQGGGKVVEGRGNIVFSEDGRIVVFGADDLVVVRTEGITLVVPRDRAPDLKSLVQQLGEGS